MEAIPTVYNGVQFRSRLEAKWATFFDLVGWKYEYEPYDFPGWIPDFVLFGLDNREIFVEVKPYVDWYQKRDKALRYIYILENSKKFNCDLLFLGSYFGEFLVGGCNLGLLLGHVGVYKDRYGGGTSSETIGGHWFAKTTLVKTNDNIYDFVATFGETRLLLSRKFEYTGFWNRNLDDAWNLITQNESEVHQYTKNAKDAIHLWKCAVNRVQWKSPVYN